MAGYITQPSVNKQVLIKYMNKLFSLTFGILLCFIQPVIAAEGSKMESGTAIIPAPYATHIARIVKDTIVAVTGSTYVFTVDTPEDKGLVSTCLSAEKLPFQITSADGSVQTYKVVDKAGMAKNEGVLITGDRLVVTAQDGKTNTSYYIVVKPMALSGQLNLQQEQITINTQRNLTLYFTAGQRSPDAAVQIFLPAAIKVTMDNTTVNVIGRGDVTLRNLSRQSIGRVSSRYSYSKVGHVAVTQSANGSIITFSHLDLRPANGPDLKMVIRNVNLSKVGKYPFRAVYTTSKPEVLTSAGTGSETATLAVIRTVSDFERILDKGLQYKESPTTYTEVSFKWTAGSASGVQLLQSLDKGKTWAPSLAKIDAKRDKATVFGLEPSRLYTFRLSVKDGENKGVSNLAYFYSGKMDIKSFGVTGEDNIDNTQKINEAIDYLSQLGGGTLLFSKGIYSVRTVHLKSNVYLYVEKGAAIKAIKGGDAPEVTWFSDKKYRSGLSPTDAGPYDDPENWLTKQDVGHHYFRNSMFFGERLDNVKIIGNGLITGNGNLVTGDKVMNNTPDNRADKMFSLKLCTNVEIGGLYCGKDLWYEPSKDAPYYINNDGSKDFDVDNMLHIDRAGHFALLATGTDNLNVHDTYFGKLSTSNVRDIYDFMACNNVMASNIFSKVSSDDIIKPGSDCSLGFTRPARHYKVRNIIGDTNCNLFQIGSETADDIMDLHVDNIYVLGANKAGFSISTNDGGHIKDVHLNCGHTGPIHSRSKMFRTFTPFFISISNRGRILGAEVGKYAFTENGEKHNELLVKNVNIGEVENIILNGIDISEVYAGSSYSGNRWKSYDGTQRRATPIIAGYRLPAGEAVEGGLNFKLPNGEHTGYIHNVVFNDVHVLVKGGNPLTDTAAICPELGVGQYNASNLKTQPSYGIWARHVKGLTLKASTFNYEKRDSRYAICLDDVVGAVISSVKMVKAADNDQVIGLKNSTGVSVDAAVYYHDQWGSAPEELKSMHPATGHAAVSFSNRNEK
jgi:polygalacturonase